MLLAGLQKRLARMEAKKRISSAQQSHQKWFRGGIEPPDKVHGKNKKGQRKDKRRRENPASEDELTEIVSKLQKIAARD